MKHLGDITKINGATATPVNVIIGGSPCQDLSVAGKRAGLAGERSGLFMEQLRIIKEMRKADADNGRAGKQIRPRYMVWENVPGAFSSNKGADFGAVLQETIRVVCKEAPVIPVPKNGWPLAGCLYGESGEWSLAWRVFDAQFWGVPQRRRRIALIADFGGTAAPEILFEREGVSGYYPQSRTPWETFTRSIKAGLGDTIAGNSDRMSYCIQGNCIDRADTAGCNGKGWTEDVSYTLNTVDRPAVAPVNVPLSDVASTLRAGAGVPKHESDIKGRLVISQPTVAGFKVNMGSKAHSIGYEEGVSPTLASVQHDAAVCINNKQKKAFVFENHGQDTRFNGPVDIAQTVSATFGMGGNNTPFVVSGFECYRKGAHPRNKEEGQTWETTKVSDTLNIFDNNENRTPILIVGPISEKEARNGY